jgi:shikimate 5-dehydrogenase
MLKRVDPFTLRCRMRTSPPPAPRADLTMEFIGVSTAQSSIMRVFPEWAAILGLDARIVGCDLPLHAPAEAYRAVVRRIKADPMTRGALVTTHKIDLLAAARDEFDDLDPLAQLCGEISSISKRGGQLRGHAKDPISSGLALDAFVPAGHWGRTGGHVLCLGAGGSAVAISVALARRLPAADRPARFIAVDLAPGRLTALEQVHRQLETDIAFEYVLNADPAHNDALMAALPPGSLVINATGMGKDRPGSPMTDGAVWPVDGLVWELNYRGRLDFLGQARRAQSARRLTVEDGWAYFLHGWTQVIAEVFDLALTPDLFTKLERAAARLRSA